MRALYLVPLALALAACSPKIPESGAGISDYNSYVKGATVAPARTTAATPADNFSADAAAAAIDASGTGSTGTAPLSATTGASTAGDRKSVV